VQQVICQSQIIEGIRVNVQAKVLVVVATKALTDAPGVVEHGGDSVEAISVEVVLVVPPTQVGQQEPQHLVLHVVEKTAVPQRVLPTGSVVEEATVGSIELVEAVLDVLGGARGTLKSRLKVRLGHSELKFKFWLHF